MSKKTQQRIEMLSFNYPYEKVRNGVWGDKAAHKPIKEIFHKLLIMEVLPDQDEDAVTTSMKEQKKNLWEIMEEFSDIMEGCSRTMQGLPYHFKMQGRIRPESIKIDCV